eukprot:gene18085-24510_t
MTITAHNYRPAVVCDIGSGFSKLGFAGNSQVTDWDSMELFWRLRIDPEDHHFLLTEPAINPAESKEQMAEIMFETFGVAGLYIGPQPVLSLYGCNAICGGESGAGAVLSLYACNAICDGERGAEGQAMTGVVVECGYDSTYVVPVVDGYVLQSSIHRESVGGSHISQYVHQLLKENGECLPLHNGLDVATQIKERYCYTCADSAKEFAQFRQQPQKSRKTFSARNPKTLKDYTINIDQARFLGPELYFNPNQSPLAMRTALSEVIDRLVQSFPMGIRRILYGNVVIDRVVQSCPMGTRRILYGNVVIDPVVQSCPISTRRRLYANVVLSGGSSIGVFSRSLICLYPCLLLLQVIDRVVQPGPIGTRRQLYANVVIGRLVQSCPIDTHRRLYANVVLSGGSSIGAITRKVQSCPIGTRRRLYANVVIDRVVQSCPIDTRRQLYANVVLSGGSSLFRNFGRRIRVDLDMITAARLNPGAKCLQIGPGGLKYALTQLTRFQAAGKAS